MIYFNFSTIIGEFFAETSRDVPYNVLPPFVAESADESIVDEPLTTLQSTTSDLLVTETSTVVEVTDGNLNEVTVNVVEELTLLPVTEVNRIEETNLTENSNQTELTTPESEQTNEIS